MEGGNSAQIAGLPGAGPVALAVGLRNPGMGYERTRHNAGAWLVMRLAQERGWPLASVSDLPVSVAGSADGVRVGVSGTYMNESGSAVAGLARYLGVEPNCLLVVHDELDLKAGVARYKFGGGTAGHNGLKDVRNRLGTGEFWRLRIGIGHPRDLEGDRANMPADRYVLEEPDATQRTLIDACLDRASLSWREVEAGDMDAAVKTLHTTAGS